MINYSSLEKSVFELINKLRQNPQLLNQDLEDMLGHFKNKYYKIPNTNINIITVEGDVAVKEALKHLKNLTPVSPLKFSEGLYLAAQDHCKDIGRRGIASHEGSDGSRMCDRIDRYGEWEISIAENISFDDSDPKEIILG